MSNLSTVQINCKRSMKKTNKKKLDDVRQQAPHVMLIKQRNPKLYSCSHDLNKC